MGNIGALWLERSCKRFAFQLSITTLNPIQVIVFNCDNTSNNDTMMEELERLHKAKGLEFNSLWARLRCMPHTVHLSELEGVLYTPPHVLTDSMRTPWGLSMSLHGVHEDCVETPWILAGLHPAFPIVHMDLWTPWGLLKQCFMDSMRTPLHEDSLWTP